MSLISKCLGNLHISSDIVVLLILTLASEAALFTIPLKYSVLFFVYILLIDFIVFHSILELTEDMGNKL